MNACVFAYLRITTVNLRQAIPQLKDMSPSHIRHCVIVGLFFIIYIVNLKGPNKHLDIKKKFNPKNRIIQFKKSTFYGF